MTKKEKIQEISDYMMQVNSAEVTLTNLRKSGIIDEKNFIGLVNEGLARIWSELYEIRESVQNDNICWESEKSDS